MELLRGLRESPWNSLFKKLRHLARRQNPALNGKRQKSKKPNEIFNLWENIHSNTRLPTKDPKRSRRTLSLSPTPNPTTARPRQPMSAEA